MLGMMQQGSNFVYSDDPSLHNKIIKKLIILLCKLGSSL